MKQLDLDFFNRDTIQVAKDLLGKVIIKTNDKVKMCYITETEAYLIDDPASHSFRGETHRNKSMFQGPGTLYVFTMHRQHCMNVVTRRGEAVLIRSAKPLFNIESRTDGPGRLCKALGITREKDDGKSLLSSNIRVADDGSSVPQIHVSPRIGITKAKESLLRFYIHRQRIEKDMSRDPTDQS